MFAGLCMHKPDFVLVIFVFISRDIVQVHLIRRGYALCEAPAVLAELDDTHRIKLT